MSKVLLKIYEMVVQSGVCPETPLWAWSEIIPFCHRKGYLYTLFEKDEPVAVVCAYRIPYFDEKFTEKYPEKEEGSILYVPWAVSNSHSFTSLLYMLNQYKLNHDIKEIAYYRRNSDTDLKRIKLHEQAKESVAS